MSSESLFHNKILSHITEVGSSPTDFHQKDERDRAYMAESAKRMIAIIPDCNIMLTSGITRMMRGFLNPILTTKYTFFSYNQFFPLILEIETEMIHKKRGGSLFYKLRKPVIYKTLDFCLFVSVLRYTSFSPLDIYILNLLSLPLFLVKVSKFKTNWM